MTPFPRSPTRIANLQPINCANRTRRMGHNLEFPSHKFLPSACAPFNSISTIMSPKLPISTCAVPGLPHWPDKVPYGMRAQYNTITMHGIAAVSPPAAYHALVQGCTMQTWPMSVSSTYRVRHWDLITILLTKASNLLYRSKIVNINQSLHHNSRYAKD